MSFFGFGGPSKPTPTPPRGPIGGGQAFPPPAAPSSKPGPFGPGGSTSSSSSSAPPPQERSRGNSGSAPSDSSSMFSSMNVVKSDVPVSTGFNFLQPAAPVAAPAAAAAASGFNFGGPAASGGAGASVAAPPAASGFAFGAAAAAPALPVAVAGGGGAGGVAPLPIAGGEIKKKKPSFRPGFAREGGDAPPSTSSTANPASQGLEAPSSFLAGMQVHTPGEGEEEQHNHQQQQGGLEGGGTLLSGLQVHSGGGGGGGGGGSGGGGGGEGEEGGGGPSSLLSGLSVRPLEGGAQIAQAPSGGISAGGFSFMSSMPPSSDSSSTTPITAGGFSLPGFGGGGAAAPLTSPADNAASSISQLPSPTRPATTHAPATAPQQPPPLDATAAMRGVIASLAEASRSARLRLADLKVRLRSVEVELVEAGAGVDRVKGEVRDLEVQQDESVRAERFEEAEVVAEKLKVVQGGALAAAEAKRGSLLALKASLLEEQEGAFEECAGAAGAAVAGLGAYEGERSRALAGLRAEVHAGHSASAERMATEEEQLRLKEQHVDSESALVEQEERGIEATIAEQTEALTRSAGELRATHATLAREVRELEEALAGKRAAESAARGALGEAEGKISAIRAKFEKQSKRLGAKREAVEGEKRECAGEAAALGAAKGEFAALKRRDRARERGLLRQLGANALEKATAEALAGALGELGGVRSALALGAAAAAQRSAALEEEVERAVRGVRANAVRRAALEAQATHLTASIAAMDAREPVLGEEKKKAVGEKKFKEAGRLNDELKRLGELREKAVRELSDCTSGVDECEAESVGLEGGVRGAQGALEVEVRAGEGGRLEALHRAVATAARHALRVGRLYKPAPIAPTVAWVDPVTLAPLGPGDMDDTPYDASPEDLAIEVPPAGVAQQAESAAAGSGPWLSTLQSAAVEILVAERDVFVEEAAAIAGRLGVPFSLGKILAEVAAEEKERGEAEGDAAAAAAAASGSFEVAASTDAAAAAGTAAAAAASSSLSEGGGDASNAPAFPLVPPTSADFTAVDSTPPLSFLSGGDSEGGGSSSVAVGGFSFLGGGGGASASGTDGGALPFSSSSSSSFPSSSFPSEGGGVEGGEVPHTEESDTSPSAGGGGGGGGVDPMVELRELAQGIRSIAAAITEKEEAISNAVGKEDYETADAIQLDIDALNEQRAKTMARALEVHGAPVSDEDILAWCEGGDGGGAAGGGGGGGGGVPEASGFSFVAQ